MNQNVNILTSFLLILFSTQSIGQNGILKLFDESIPEAAVFLDIVNDNDTLVFYGLTGDSLNRQGIGFYRIDTFGNVLNKRLMVDTARLFTTSAYSRKRIIKTSDGLYAMIGTTNAEIGSSVGTPYFVKIDKNLNIVNRVIYESQIYTSNASLIEDESGYLIVNRTEPPELPAADDVLVIKTDKSGNEVWRKQYGMLEFGERPERITKLNSNEYVINGSFYVPADEDGRSWPLPPWYAGYLLAIDSSGNELWSWPPDTTVNTSPIINAIPLVDGGWMCAGGTWELYDSLWHTDEYRSRPKVYRLDSDLNIVWEQVFGHLGHFQNFRDLNQTPDGHFLVSGYVDFIGNGPAKPRGVHYKFTAEGDSIWMRKDSVYPSSSMNVTASEILSSGSIISIGYVQNGPYGQTGFIMKMSKDGCVDTLNCFPVSTVNHFIYESDVLTVYPNPTIETVTINLSEKLAYDKNSIIVRNIAGQTIYHAEVTGAQVSIDVSMWNAGQYFIELRGKNGKGFGRFVKID